VAGMTSRLRPLRRSLSVSRETRAQTTYPRRGVHRATHESPRLLGWRPRPRSCGRPPTGQLTHLRRGRPAQEPRAGPNEVCSGQACPSKREPISTRRVAASPSRRRQGHPPKRGHLTNGRVRTRRKRPAVRTDPLRSTPAGDDGLPGSPATVPGPARCQSSRSTHDHEISNHRRDRVRRHRCVTCGPAQLGSAAGQARRRPQRSRGW
jgi:hypothetical protein